MSQENSIPVNKKIRLCGFIVIAILVYSCEGDVKQSSYEEIEAAPIEDTIKAQEISFKGETKILNPRKIENISNKFLVILEERERGIFRVFDLPGLDFLYSWGRKGRGPGELSIIGFSTSVNVKNNQLIIYDPNLAKLKFYTVNDTAIVYNQEKPLDFDYQVQPLNGILRLDDSLYIAKYGMAPNNTKEFVALVPGEGAPLFTFSRYPKIQVEDEERYEKYTKLVVAKPDGAKFAAFYNNYNKFKIFNNKGRTLKEINVKDPYLMGKSDEGFNYHRISAKATDNYIYILILNYTKKEISNNPEDIRPLIEIWDWKGNPISRFKLDRAVQRFSISEKYSKLYAVPILKIRGIYEYDLSFIRL